MSSRIGKSERQKGTTMRKVATESLNAVVKNGNVHISKADDKRVFAKVRITTNTAKSSKKIEQILKAMGQYPDFNKVLDAVLKVEPNAYVTLKGGARA
jgi:hypothetical protein